MNQHLQSNEDPLRSLARVAVNPECLSASVLTLCQKLDPNIINEMVDELKRQSALVHANDLSRAESMLTAQAHTLDGLFARLTHNALTCGDFEQQERYMKLAFRAQSQARATLQTLAELKVPKQIAFVEQANIGNQVQVNNGGALEPTRARKRNCAKRTIGGWAWRTVGLLNGGRLRRTRFEAGSLGSKVQGQRLN
jgi:hypothetical protein